MIWIVWGSPNFKIDFWGDNSNHGANAPAIIFCEFTIRIKNVEDLNSFVESGGCGVTNGHINNSLL